MEPEIHLFGITLQSFGLLLALAIVGSGITVHRHLVERGAPADWAYEMIFAALVGGLIGARLYWLIEHPSAFSDDPLGSVFGGTGLTWYGGAFGGAICVLGWARWRGVSFADAADLSAVPLAVGYALGRIGCQVSGDGDYGRPWGGPWAMPYPKGTLPTDVPVHPTPIYETVAVGLLAYALWVNRHRFAPGVLLGLYLVGTGVERFLVEFLRRNADDVGGAITEAQLIALVLVLLGAAIAYARRGAPGGRGRRLVAA
jgi:phosphatidylglycerol---prolipoprotein diacylglyceryl transferase